MKFEQTKNILPLFLLCLTILFFPIYASADVLFGKAYYQTLHKYLTQSKSSISLSMRAKYMYLICLYEAGHSTRYPFWFRSQEDMAKLYGISDTTISLGLQELEEKGIIEIIRDKPMPPDFSDRKANVYRMLSLTRSPVKGE